jgi:hypothetical protein
VSAPFGALPQGDNGERMSTLVFVLLYVAGATSIAVWCDWRFPRARPGGLGRLAVAATLAIVLDNLITQAVGIMPRFVAVMGLVLPASTATLLVCIWVLRVMRAQIST